MKLDNLGGRILTEIAIAYPAVTLDIVKLIYRNLGSIDETIAILETSSQKKIPPFRLLIEYLVSKGEL